jgi:hypothetical protein
MLGRCTLTLIALVLGATGCTFMARSPERYRDDTEALLQTRAAAIKSCYNEARKSFPTTEGRVTVRFTVERETGKIAGAAVDEGQTTAPPALHECVLEALDGLALSPPDDREGQATFVWEFHAPPESAPAT